MTNRIKIMVGLLLLALLISIMFILVFCKNAFYFTDMLNQRQSHHNQQLQYHHKTREFQHKLKEQENLFTVMKDRGFFKKPSIQQLIVSWTQCARHCHIYDIHFQFKTPQIQDNHITVHAVVITMTADLDSDIYDFVKLLEQQRETFLQAYEITVLRDSNHINGKTITGVHAQITCDVIYCSRP